MEPIRSNSLLTQAVQEYADFPKSFTETSASRPKKTAQLYILVNASLRLSPGKVASQVGHAVEKLMKNWGKNASYKAYQSFGSAKIVLNVPTEEEFVNILDRTKHLLKVYIIDAGLTQCPRNSVTVVGYEPLFQERVPDAFKPLSLYNK